MESIMGKPEAIFGQFAGEVEGIFGKEVVSVIVFGSAVTDEYVPKRSDINFLVVLTQEGIDGIHKIHRIVSRWEKRRISLPLFVTKSYIEASLDSFPIEFLNMQAAYSVIRGEDVLKDLQIKKEDVRLQCEREMKGHLLKLRQGYVQTEGKAKALRLLIARSIVSFVSIFRALLHLRGKEIPKKKQDVLLAACREFGLDEGLFSVLFSVKKYETKLSRVLLESNIRRYISEIEKLTKVVDLMEFTTKKKK
ncbi:MAG: nucleotidyltransferase domain-containing protein [bacterium]